MGLCDWQGEAALLVVFVIVFSDSDRVGRGEWSRVYDACMVVRVYLSGLRAPCMPRRCLRRLETRHPYHLGGVFWYGSSISIIIYLSLIRGMIHVWRSKPVPAPNWSHSRKLRTTRAVRTN